MKLISQKSLCLRNTLEAWFNFQKSAVSIHSAKFGRQVVFWPTPHQGDLNSAWSSDGANGCWQSVFLQLVLLGICIQGQQLDLLIQLSLPHHWDGAWPQPLNTKRKVSCAGGIPPGQGRPRLESPPVELLLGGAHALEFAGQPEGLVLCVVGIVGRQESFPAASAATVTRLRGGGGGCNRERVGGRQRGLLLLLFGAEGSRVDLKGVVELGVVDSEEALLQRHDGEEAVGPQHFVFSVRRPRLACHTYDGEHRHNGWEIFRKTDEEKKKKRWKEIVGKKYKWTEIKSGEWGKEDRKRQKAEWKKK